MAKTLNNEEVDLVSNCCSCKLKVDCGDEGTCCYICECCQNHCDAKVIKERTND